MHEQRCSLSSLLVAKEAAVVSYKISMQQNNEIHQNCFVIIAEKYRKERNYRCARCVANVLKQTLFSHIQHVPQCLFIFHVYTKGLTYRQIQRIHYQPQVVHEL